jgi:hypothetical protein
MKKSKPVYLGLLAVVIMLLITQQAAAQWAKSTRGNGNVVSTERQVGDFSGVEVNCSANVYLTQGTKTAVRVITDENLQEKIETTVSGNVLEIDVDGSITRTKKLDVYVTVENLNKIRINGSGDVESENVIKGIDLAIDINGSGNVEVDLDMKNVETSINGSGDVELSGVAGDFELKVTGSGSFKGTDMRLNNCNITVLGSGDVELRGSATKVDAKQSASGDINLYNLTAQDVNAKSNGSGDVVVSVSGTLNVRLNGSGDLTYTGTPVSVDVSSSGSGEVFKR